MLYRLVRPVARYVLGYYFRNIDLSGLEHIPRDAPIILAANHPSAFLEPCLMACFQQRPLHFLARGDLFKNRLATLVLRSLNILPVYRIQDGGYEKLTRNYATFEACYRVLHRRQALMILAEGRCIHEKRLRPLRKGTARIALGALKAMPSPGEVYIVPVGVNFVAAERVRTTVMIRCGAPIRSSHYLATYRQSEARAIHALTDELRIRLSELVIQLPDPETDEDYEGALSIARTAMSRNHGLTHDGRQLAAERFVAARYVSTDYRIPEFMARLKQHRISAEALSLADADSHFPVSSAPALLLLLPQLPLWLTAELIARLGPKTIEFYSPVRFAAVGVGTVLYLPLLPLLPWKFTVYLSVSLLSTRWALRRVETAKRWWGARRAAALAPSLKEELRTLRAGLVK